MNVLSTISMSFIPMMFTGIILHGLWKREPVYDHFIEGAKDGIKTATEILPFLIAIFIGIEALVSSGAMNFLQSSLEPVLALLGIPKELASLVLLRPVSGSGSLAVLERLLATYGADGLVGRAASVMAGTCETVFYVLAVYFGATSVKKIRHALSAGIIGYVVGVVASVWVCRFL